MTQLLLKSEIKNENDIAWVRKKTRELASFLKIEGTDQIRLATAVSEIARNTFQYAGSGQITFNILKENEVVSVLIEVKDRGPGIKDLEQILKGNYISKSGMGVGLMGARKLVDELIIDSNPMVGTSIILKKRIPSRTDILTTEEVKALSESFMTSSDTDPIAEIQKQNREILLTMDELQEKKQALQELNNKLEEQSLGMKALYAELDEKAKYLSVANESKTSFLSDMTHEFRSPLNSIINISRFLLEDAEDEKAQERIAQIGFIIKASVELSGMVNDLLDLAKIEAGKIQIRSTEFSIHTLIRTLRGLMGPLSTNKNVTLIFNEPLEDILMAADEVKLTQILRNLVTNALKFTEKGEITIQVQREEDQGIRFVITDTGIGIPESRLKDIFSEFVQVENHLQQNSKGTGLGLPLSLKLAHLLGGNLSVQSILGQGTVFQLVLPLTYTGPEEAEYSLPLERLAAPVHQMNLPLRMKRVLMVDDDVANRYRVERLLKDLPIEFKEASDGEEAWVLTQSFEPDLIILDLVMPKMDGAGFIQKLLENQTQSRIPILLYTSKELSQSERKYFETVTRSIIRKDSNSGENVRSAVEFFIS